MIEKSNHNTQVAAINGSALLSQYAALFAPLYLNIKNEVVQGLKTDNELWRNQEILCSALKYGDLASIPKETARAALPAILDASDIPHSDLAVNSKIVHSKRHIISQWQRQAAGAIITVLGRDKEGDLCIALGQQRGVMSVPQGYMESQLPKDDESGLRAQNASRMNSTTGEIVKADKSIKECAAREVLEELGIKVAEDKLRLIDVTSHNPIVTTIEVNYGVLLDSTPKLKTLDMEFKNDDLTNPEWFKVKDIKCLSGHCFPDGSKLRMKQCNIPAIQQAINTLATDVDKESCKGFLDFKTNTQAQGRTV